MTQGPLAHTTADFWQMVWEQGSVVIVMLSRLAENGYQLVHRYWPEEGSETYHIYEVSFRNVQLLYLNNEALKNGYIITRILHQISMFSNKVGNKLN